MAKQLLNAPKTAVLETIEGLVSSTPHLNRLDGFPRIKVVLNEAHDRSKVAIISGGGSGHEPMHAGFVGSGMLAAAVCGEVFASPSVEAILAAIHAVTGPAGCLLVVKNYTGDRLNFGIAAEKAKAAGLKVDHVVVAEDCALANRGIAGRRGLAGTILVHKVSGAAAASGASLQEVKSCAAYVVRHMGTLAAAFTLCTLPGGKQQDRLGPGDMEVGLGIHGEPGAFQCPVMPCDQLMEKLVDMIVDKQHNFLTVDKGDQVVLLMNSLGSTPPLELSIGLRGALHAINNKLQADIIRVYCGTLCTSLDMSGVSLTILKLTGDRAGQITQLLDAPTDAPAWPSGSHIYIPNKAPIPVPEAMSLSGCCPKPEDTPVMTQHQAQMLENMICAAANSVIAAREELNALDAKVGDGDCGSTLALGATAILSDIRDAPLQYCTSTPAEVALKLAEAVGGMGGTSGALYQIMFTAAAGSLGGASESPSMADWCAAVKCGVDAVQQYGGAAPGSRTMVDALVPAVQAWEQAISKGVTSGRDIAQLVAQASAEGALSTQGMVASAGRSSYVPEDTLRGVPDPGAQGVAIWISAISKEMQT